MVGGSGMVPAEHPGPGPGERGLIATRAASEEIQSASPTAVSAARTTRRGMRLPPEVLLNLSADFTLKRCSKTACCPTTADDGEERGVIQDINSLDLVLASSSLQPSQRPLSCWPACGAWPESYGAVR